MHIDSFNKSNEYVLRSAPVPVRMAGFESNTLALQNSGWQISIETRQHWAYDGYELATAFKHDGIKQVAYGRMNFDRQSMYSGDFTGFIKTMGIDIIYIAPMIQIHNVVGQRSMTFQPIDARPELVRRESFDLEKIGMFKPIKTEDFEIYINQKDEQEILDILLKKQDPRQKEIRQNQKRRSYLEGNGGSEDGMSDNINTDVRHQITLVS